MDTVLFTLLVRLDIFQSGGILKPDHDRLGGDVLAGVTVASMLIPQSVSYASSLAKLSPITGLVRYYAADVPCLLLITFLSSPHLSLELYTHSLEHLANSMSPQKLR